MSIYETTTRLASEIKESKEYKEFQKNMKEIREDKECEDLLKNYKFAKVQTQSYSMGDPKLYKKSKMRLDSLQKKINSNKKILRYLKSEQNFSQMMNNINKILAQSVEQDYK